MFEGLEKVATTTQGAREVIPMKERVKIAVKEMNEGGYHSTMKELAAALNWSETTVQRVCAHHPRIRKMLSDNADKPLERLKAKRAKREKVPMQPIIKQLYDAVTSSENTYKEVLKKAGMSEEFFRDVFNRGHLPRMQSVMAVLEVVGYKLEIVKDD